MARLQFRLRVQRKFVENAFRVFSRVPCVRRALLAAPDRVKRDGSATSASPAISELTTPLAISSAVSSKGAREAANRSVSARPTLPEVLRAPLRIVFSRTDVGTNVVLCRVTPASTRNCQEVAAGCQRAKVLNA